jgi:hypothetical protein
MHQAGGYKMKRIHGNLLLCFAVAFCILALLCGRASELKKGRVFSKSFASHKSNATAGHPSQPLCKGYDGILFISSVKSFSGAGTVFFITIVDSLIYAETHNLLPFIHINNDWNSPCYDPKYHGKGPNVTYTHLYGNVSDTYLTGNMTCWKDKKQTEKLPTPGPPNKEGVALENITLKGNGLWSSYFAPVPSVHPLEDESCSGKPVFELAYSQIRMSMHRCWALSVRSWPYRHLPEPLKPTANQSIHDWLGGHRNRASQIVKKHFTLLPDLQKRVKEANPNPRNCLAAHIRLTDKAKSSRNKSGLKAYLPYIEAYAKASDKDGSPIYIATDDARVLEELSEKWSNGTYNSRIISLSGAKRSTNNKPTFALLKKDKHRSNTEALVEIHAMARCSFLVHGFSGMSEAAVYLNPALHNRSVNIDDGSKMTPAEFGNMVEVFFNGQ